MILTYYEDGDWFDIEQELIRTEKAMNDYNTDYVAIPLGSISYSIFTHFPFKIWMLVSPFGHILDRKDDMTILK